MNGRYMRVIGVLAACGFAISAAAAGPELKYVKPVALPAFDKEELVAVPLDSDVYEVTRAGFPDVRLLNAQGQEVPYLLRKAVATRDETIRATWVSRRPLAAKPLENNALEIVVELGRDDPMPSGLRLVSPLANFEQRVKVEFSPDGQTWETLVGDGLIFDYSRFIDVRSDSVEWPARAAAEPTGTRPADAPARRLRITIDEVTKEQESQLMELTKRLRATDVTDQTQRLIVDRRPFRVDRIELWQETFRDRVTGDRTVEYLLGNLETKQDADTRQTLVTVTSRREPLTSISLVTDARNFSRAARVQVAREHTGGESWHDIGSGTLSRIDFRQLDRTYLDIAFPENRQPRYRLVIDNRDSPPLAIGGLAAKGAVYEVVFLAEPNAAYRLAYGGQLAAPSYDTAALTAALAARYQPLAATLGEQSVLTAEVLTGEPLLKRLINDPRLLGMAIVLLVLLLGLGLYRASQRVNNLPGT